MSERGIWQNEGTAALREATVLLVSPTTGNPVTGKSEATVTIKTAKPGANFVGSSATLTEITGGAVGGLYRIRFTTGEVDTVGELAFEISDASIQVIRDSVTIMSPLRAADLAADCITAAKIATDAIDADALKTDAVDEIKAAVATAVWAATKSSNRSANSMGDVLQAVAAKLLINAMIDQITHGTNGLPTVARTRVFDTSTDLDSATPDAGGDEGAIYKFSETAVDLSDNGKFSSMKHKRTL